MLSNNPIPSSLRVFIKQREESESKTPQRTTERHREESLQYAPREMLDRVSQFHSSLR